ncbi:60S ribosomal protein [Venturia inaequalis]|nr:60S ribosomal protein [Venturia inaequalis]
MRIFPYVDHEWQWQSGAADEQSSSPLRQCDREKESRINNRKVPELQIELEVKT